MAPSRTSCALLALLAVLPASLASFECNNIIAKDQPFNFKELGGPRVVHYTHSDPMEDIEYRYNFTLDICSVLKRDKDVPKNEWCHDGVRVCGTRQTVDLTGSQNSSILPIDIAGTYTMQGGLKMALDAKFQLFREPGANSDVSRQGVRAELHGGRLPFEKKDGMSQQAVIEFVCDPGREGTEDGEMDNGEKDDEKPKDGDNKDKDEGDKKDGDKKDDDKKEERSLRSRDEEFGKCEKSNKSLRFCGYEEEKIEDKRVKTLRLEWRTKYACENAPNDDGGKSWGFFTWFIIILFLVTAAYLIFGSWLNYNRYGARGWDLLPHGDAIRDIPYVLKDLGRKVVSTVQSPGGRGGYSAV